MATDARSELRIDPQSGSGAMRWAQNRISGEENQTFGNTWVMADGDGQSRFPPLVGGIIKIEKYENGSPRRGLRARIKFVSESQEAQSRIATQPDASQQLYGQWWTSDIN